MTQGHVTKLKFYLADVDAIVQPLAVLPNIGGKSNSYWIVKPRNQWAALFGKWLKDSHKNDAMSDPDDSDED
jgi:hypothetical protein